MLRVTMIAITFVMLLPSAHSQLDTLEQKLTTLQGKERARHVINSMSLMATYDREMAILYGEEVMADLDQLNLSSYERYDFIYKLGTCYSTNKIDSLESIISGLRGISDDDDFRVAVANLLESYRLQTNGLFNESLEEAVKANDYFEKENDFPYIARVTYMLGSLHYDLGNLDEALEWTDKSMEASKMAELTSLQVSCLTLKGALLREKGETEEARVYFNQSLELADKVGNKNSIARISNQVGIFEANKGNYEAAYKHFKKAMILHEELGNESSYMQMINNIGVVHRIKGEYDSAIVYFKKVIEVSEANGAIANQALATSNVGVMYMDLNKHGEAVAPLEKALKLYRETGSLDGQGRVLNNLGNVYRIHFKDFDKAIEYLEESLAIREKMGRKEGMARAIHNIGDLYREKGDFESASNYYNRALVLKKELGDKESMVATYFGLGKLTRNTGKSEVAIQYVDSALSLAIEVGAKFLIRDIQEFLAEYYAELGDYQKAYENHVAYKTTYDSLFTTENESVIAEIQEEFKTKEQQQQIELLEEKRRNQNMLLAGLTGGAVLLAILVGVVYNRYRLKNRSNKIIQEKSDELERSNKELKELSEFKRGMTNMIAHDIKNPLNSIIGLSNKLGEKVGNDISKAGEAILRLITNMLDIEKFEDTKPTLSLERTRLSDLIAEAKLAVELLLYDKSIQLEVALEQDVQISVDRDLITRVFVNLLSNAVKFSPSNDFIRITSSVTEVEDKQYIKIGVSDNGSGIPKEDQPFLFEKFYQSDAKKSGITPSTGLGLTFCKMALTAHDGTISVESKKGQGSTFFIMLEVEEVEGKSVQLASKNADLAISANDQEKLKSYSAQLKELKVHNVSAIMAILDEIEDLGLETKWPDQLRSAVQYSNKGQYEELVKMIG